MRINFEKGSFVVKTVESSIELEEVLRLRYEIFHREFRNKKFPFGMDFDRFDKLADHLIIVDRRIQKIVGTYRLISTTNSPSFYSQAEFELDGLMSLPGTKLELTRACIQKDYRTGAVMNLLWRGISSYLKQVGAEYLFGCPSLKTVSINDACRAYRFLRESGYLSSEMSFLPTKRYEVPDFHKALAELERKEAPLSPEVGKHLLPPLFHSYFKAGAKVCSLPALDNEFRCIDFFTVLRISDLNRAHERKYSPC